MIRTLSSVLLVAAFAAPAMAADITVHVAGRSPAAVQADVERAAHTVCRQAYKTMHVGLEEQWACERATANEAMAKVRASAMASTAPASVSLASADTVAGNR